MNFLNGIIRNLLSLFFKALSCFFDLSNFLKRRKRSHKKKTGRPRSYEDLRSHLQKIYDGMGKSRYWAQTSGTRKEPKLIPFDNARTDLVQRVFTQSMITLTGHYYGKKTFFVFSSLTDDQSLTSGLIAESKKPRYLDLLQAPYRYLLTIEGEKLRMLVGDLTARVIVLTVTCPRFLYATNPSTICHFFDQVELHHKEVKMGVSDFLNKIIEFDLLLSLADGNALARLKNIHKKDISLVDMTMSKVQAFISWDGGYTQNFVEQLKLKFPGTDHLPMFSMSTEAILTVPHKINGEIYFLPISPNVETEFLDLLNLKILQPKELKLHEYYSMLVSDCWGLTRYDTQDIFYVERIIEGWPDLRFIKRRGITSSITGEKITEEQVILLTKDLVSLFPSLASSFLSLYPTIDKGKHGYSLAILGTNNLDLTNIRNAAEELLGKINGEYKSKVESGRLFPIVAHCCSVAELAALMKNSSSWESQFKVLPLYEKVIRKD